MPAVKASIDTLVLTRVATGVVSQNKFVSFADAQAGLDAAVLGISKMDAAIGDALPVRSRSRWPSPSRSRRC